MAFDASTDTPATSVAVGDVMVFGDQSANAEAGGWDTIAVEKGLKALADVTDDAAGVRTALGAQAAADNLTALAGLTSAADRLPYFTGSGTAAVTVFSAFARTLLDDADAATAIATLGAAGTGVANTFTVGGHVVAPSAATTTTTLILKGPRNLGDFSVNANILECTARNSNNILLQVDYLGRVFSNPANLSGFGPAVSDGAFYVAGRTAASTPFQLAGADNQSVDMISLFGVTTTSVRKQLGIKTDWPTKTDASRQARLSVGVYGIVSSAETFQEVFRADATASGVPTLGFLGATPVVRQSGDIGAGLVALGLFTSTARVLSATADVTTVTGNFSVGAADTGKSYAYDSGSGGTCTLAGDAPLGTQVAVAQIGTGQVTFAVSGSGILLNIDTHTKTEGQGAEVVARVMKVNAGNATWVLSGRTAA